MGQKKKNHCKIESQGIDESTSLGYALEGQVWDVYGRVICLRYQYSSTSVPLELLALSPPAFTRLLLSSCRQTLLHKEAHRKKQKNSKDKRSRSPASFATKGEVRLRGLN